MSEQACQTMTTDGRKCYCFKVIRGLFASVAVTVFSGLGCAFNSSPIHSDLSCGELQNRITSNFRIGEPWQEVRAHCKALSLDPQRKYSETSVCTGAIGDSYAVVLNPPGLRFDMWYSYRPSLVFGFDDGPSLLCVQHVSLDADGRSERKEALLP